MLSGPVTLTTRPVFHSLAKERDLQRAPWLLTPLSTPRIHPHANDPQLPPPPPPHTTLLPHTHTANSSSLFVSLTRRPIHVMGSKLVLVCEQQLARLKKHGRHRGSCVRLLVVEAQRCARPYLRRSTWRAEPFSTFESLTTT